MKTLSKITKNIRSKNAGPFWVTVDLFFKDKYSFFYACKNGSLFSYQAYTLGYYGECSYCSFIFC